MPAPANFHCYLTSPFTPGPPVTTSVPTNLPTYHSLAKSPLPCSPPLLPSTPFSKPLISALSISQSHSGIREGILLKNGQTGARSFRAPDFLLMKGSESYGAGMSAPSPFFSFAIWKGARERGAGDSWAAIDFSFAVSMELGPSGWQQLDTKRYGDTPS